jgi:deazaflavin-dependent oxidoreductase (nitroreductase family)
VRFADQRAEFNRLVVNRLVRPLSGRVPLWSLVEHVGRRSGRIYRTPVSAFSTPDGVAILLPYGEDRDWVKNLQAAGRGRVVLSGKTFEVRDPRIVPTGAAVSLLRAPWRQVVAAAQVPSALLLERANV